MGRDPSKLVIAAAATAELAEANSRDVKRIMQSAPHQELFGNLWDDKDNIIKDTDKVFQFRQGGTYNAAGTGNNIAGRGADYIIVDDYVNNRKQAESDTQRDDHWQWFLDDILTRRHYPASTLVMATRWHFDDIIGRLQNGAHDEPWTVVHFPKMLDGDPGPFDLRTQHGEMLLSPFALAPWEYLAGQTPPKRDDFLQKDPILVTLAEVQKREYDAFNARMIKNPYGISALEQGDPTPKGGGLFQKEWINRYTSTPEAQASVCEYKLISVDASFKDTKNSDNCAIVVFGRRGNLLFILDEDVGKMDYPALKARLTVMATKYPSATIVIEDKANGSALIAELKKELPRVIAFDPTPYGNKASRAQVAADRYQGGSILHPEPGQAAFIEEFELELGRFPYSKRDDRIDALSQAVLFMDKRRSATARLNNVTSTMQSLFGD